MKLAELIEKCAAKAAEMRAINDKASTENRDLDGGARRRWDVLDKDVSDLTVQIDRARKVADFERFEARSEPPTGFDASGMGLAVAERDQKTLRACPGSRVVMSISQPSHDASE